MATVEDRMPALVEAPKVVGAFQTMVRAMEPGQLEGWLRRAEASWDVDVMLHHTVDQPRAILEVYSRTI